MGPDSLPATLAPVDQMICRVCGVTKIVSDFPKRRKKHGFSPRQPCKRCVLDYQRDHYRRSGKRRADISAANEAYKRRAREWVIAYLRDHPCIDCGEDDPIVLDFDHRDPQKKEDGIGSMVANGVTLSRIQAEIEKCDVRCANCHRRRTAVQLGWYRASPDYKNAPIV